MRYPLRKMPIKITKQYFSLCSLIEDYAFEIHEFPITAQIPNLRRALFYQVFYYANLLDRSFEGKTYLGDKVYVYMKKRQKEVGIKIGDGPTIIINKQPNPISLRK